MFQIQNISGDCVKDKNEEDKVYPQDIGGLGIGGCAFESGAE